MGNPFSALFGRRHDDGGGLPAAVSAEQALQMVADGATLVDVREPAEWRGGHAPRAVHIPLGRLAEHSGRIPAGRPVVVVCASGSRSRTAAKQLRAAGMEATSLSGGLVAWQAAGGSVRSGR